jgi:hypothetical protein
MTYLAECLSHLELGIKHALKQNTDASKQNIEIGDKMVK